MKIKKVSIKAWKAKLKTPFKIATGSHASLNNLLLTLELENGIKGYGEACIAKHITGETVAGTRTTLLKIAKLLKGRHVTEYLELFLEIEAVAQNNRCALAAAEMAILDAFTRSLKEPLWKIFGSHFKKIQSDMTIVIGSVVEAEAAAKQVKRNGFKVIKLKVGKDIALDLERVKAVAKGFPKAKLILDANQGFTVKSTLQFLNQLKRLKIKPVLIEQPIAKSNFKGMVELSRKSHVMICADETASSVEDIQKLIELGFRGAVNIKFVKFGIQRAWEAMQICKKHKLKLMMGVMMESPIATTAAAHFVVGAGGFDFIDLDSAYFMRDRVTRGYAIGKNGVYDLSSVKSGIGVEPC